MQRVYKSNPRMDLALQIDAGVAMKAFIWSYKDFGDTSLQVYFVFCVV